MERKNAWLSYDKKQKKELYTLGEDYRVFLSKGKTERECVDLSVAEAEKAGYISLEKAIAAEDYRLASYLHHELQKRQKPKE